MSGKTLTDQPDGLTLKPKAGNYVITSAVNDVGVHKGALAAMRAMAKRKRAELIVIKQHYRNPTAAWSSQEHSKTWDPEIAHHTVSSDINAGVVSILGSMRVQATSPNPLYGKGIYAKTAINIVGSARQQLDSVPRLPQMEPKFTLTTGSCTMPEYSSTDAGVRAKDNHVLGCVLIEYNPETKRTSARQLTYNKHLDGIYDVDGLHTAKCLRKESVDTIVLGDVHAETQSIDAKIAALRQIRQYRPKFVMLHDLVSVAVNNHHSKVGMLEFFEAEAHGNISTLTQSISIGADFVNSLPGYVTPVMVPSNHDLMLKSWVLNNAWQDAYNDIDLMLWCVKRTVDLLRGGTRLKNVNLMADYLRTIVRHKRFKTLEFGETFIRNGVALHIHGHDGINGARGSVASFSKSSMKVIHGHTHSPMRRDGAMSVGTMEHITDNSYTSNSGMTSWAYVNAALFADGKRTHLLEA